MQQVLSKSRIMGNNFSHAKVEKYIYFASQLRYCENNTNKLVCERNSVTDMVESCDVVRI